MAYPEKCAQTRPRTEKGRAARIAGCRVDAQSQWSGEPAEPAPIDSARTLGLVVRRARLERGLTLQNLADELRQLGHACSKSYLSELENGRRPLPDERILVSLERTLGLGAGSLAGAARWDKVPESFKREVSSLASQHREQVQQKRRTAQRLQEILAQTTPDAEGGLRGRLDAAFRSGELERLVRELEGQPSQGSEPGSRRTLIPVTLGHEVPLINSVAAGYPREFTDLGYPARVADQYIRVPDIADADAFAARVVGDSMAPAYLEGDVVVFSPARPVTSGADCFARLEPDQQTTFKRVYFETDPRGEPLIRLQPINPAYPARTLPREQVAGLYAAVSVMRRIG